MVPSITGFDRMKAAPANTRSSVTGSRFGTIPGCGIEVTAMLARRNMMVATTNGTTGPTP